MLKQFFLSFLFLAISCSLFSERPHDYLRYKIAATNHRYETFQYALELMEKRNVQIIVETGTARFGDRNFDGDGGSTIIFAEWARDHGAEFFSIDIDPANLVMSQAATALYVPNYPDKIHYICKDSIAYLAEFNRKIDFLYLDSFDYELDNPTPSQQHHLKEIQAVYPFLTKNSVIMIDDCNLPGGGKGKLAIAFLLEREWKIVKSGYQVILTQSYTERD